MDVYPIIIEALHNRYDIAIDAVMPETTLEALQVDSLGLVELLFEVEDRLGVSAPQDFPTPTTIADVAALVQSMLAVKEGKAA